MTTRPLARQVDFDQLVKESVEGGLHSWEEAIQEAKETFEESDYDLSGLFFYTNEKEYQVKQEMEAKYRTFEEVASGKQTLVNMTFAIQGLLQTLRAHDPRGNVMIGSKRLFEQRNGFHTVLMILKEISRQESSQEDGDRSDGEEDSDEDEDDDFSHYRKLLLEAFSTLLFGEFAGNPSGYRNIQQFLCLTEEEAPFVVQLLDDVSDEAEVVFGLLEVLEKVLQVPSNVDLLRTASLSSGLDLIKKLHKKKDPLVNKVDLLLSKL